MSVRIVTKTSKGKVTTSYSNDQWNQPGWQSVWTVLHLSVPIEEIIDMKVAQSWEEAGRNHLSLCESIK